MGRRNRRAERVRGMSEIEFMSMSRRRLLRVVRRTSQGITDALAWNDFHPEHPPLDVEVDRIVLRTAERALAALHKFGPRSDEYSELCYELVQMRRDLDVGPATSSRQGGPAR